MNISIRRGTEYTLHELVFGRSARIPIKNILPDNKGSESYPECMTALFNQIFASQASACENYERAKIKSKILRIKMQIHKYLKRTIMYIY